MGEWGGGLQGALEVPPQFREIPVAVPAPQQEIVHVPDLHGGPGIQPPPTHHLPELPSAAHGNLLVCEGGATIPGSHAYKARRELGEDGQQCGHDWLGQFGWWYPFNPQSTQVVWDLSG